MSNTESKLGVKLSNAAILDTLPTILEGVQGIRGSIDQRELCRLTLALAAPDIAQALVDRVNLLEELKVVLKPPAELANSADSTSAGRDIPDTYEIFNGLTVGDYRKLAKLFARL